MDDELRAYLAEMGGDPGLIDFATRVRPDRIHWMSREEIERYHIETRGYYEAPWTARQAHWRTFRYNQILDTEQCRDSRLLHHSDPISVPQFLYVSRVLSQRVAIRVERQHQGTHGRGC